MSPSPTDAARVLLFTKPARPGRVKTRLIGALTAEQAAQLHAAFVGDVVERLRRGRFVTEVRWALEPGEERPPLEDALLAPLPLAGLDHHRQEGDSLGDRLFLGLSAAARGTAKVAAIGSDHPTLPLARVEEALAALDRAPVVLGPAEDGGYYLVAVRAEALDRRLFAEIDWSTERVLRQTLDRCRELGLEPHLLPEGRDVDLPADLDRLAGEIAEDGHDCPRTRALLAAWGRLEGSP